MEAHDNLNFLLESINGVILLQAACLLLVLVAYLLSELGKNRKQSRWENFLRSRGMALAAALIIQESGVMFTRGTIFAWRKLWDGEAAMLGRIDYMFIVLGTCMSAIGLIWLTKILSRPMFGHWPWVTTTMLSLAYVAWAVVSHYS